LTCDIHKESKLSEETVARMLALEDYVEAISKSEKVASELAGMIEMETAQRASTAEALKTKEVELQNLSKVARVLEAPEALTTKGGELAEEISAAVNTAFKPDARITPSLVQSWRAEVEEELSRIRERLTTAREMEVQFPRLQELTLQLSNLREQYEQRKQALAQAHALLDAQQRELAKLERTARFLSKDNEV